MDKELENVREFHKAFGCVVNETPTWPDDLSAEDLRTVKAYATELSITARKLKDAAAFANADGRDGLGLMLVRLQLTVEETAELAHAIADKNQVEVLDALTDISYVNNGNFLTFGMGNIKSVAHTIVHSSNMSKLGEGGFPIISAAGRVVKGPNYRDPKPGLTDCVKAATIFSASQDWG